MASVIPLLLIPSALTGISPTFDVRDATARAVRLLAYANRESSQPIRVRANQGPSIKTSFTRSHGVRKNEREFEVETPLGTVRFSAVSGRVVSALLSQSAHVSKINFSRSECEGIARRFVREAGLSNVLTLDSEVHGSSTGFFDFWFHPTAFGISSRHPIRVTVHAKSGQVHFYRDTASLPPISFQSRIDPGQIERDAHRRIAKEFGPHELMLPETTRWSIEEPPNARSKWDHDYQAQRLKGEGIVVYSVSVIWPSREPLGGRDHYRARYDGSTGRFIGGELLPSKLILQAGGPYWKWQPEWTEWKANADSIEVYNDQKTIHTVGKIVAASGSVTASCPTITLRFRDRLFVARFDRKQGLIQVGDRVGKPSPEVLRALWAVTQ